MKEESYSSHLGKIKLQERYSKQLKPVTDKLESIPKSIASVLEPTLSAIPTALAALPSEAVAINQLLNQPAFASSSAPQAAVTGAPTTGFTPTTLLQIEDI
jgi:hypothetical protein